MTFYIFVACSVGLNLLLIWYLTRLLRKFYFISENLAGLFLTLRSFQVFTTNMYSMDSYHGEPMIQELVHRIKEANVEMEEFREIFEFSLDEELEEELNATEEET